MPDGACAYPAYEYVSVWLKPHAGWRFAYPAYEGDSVWLKPRAGWRLRLSGLRICFGVAETTCRMALTLIQPTKVIRCG